MTDVIRYEKRVPLPFGIKARPLTMIECYFECANPVEKGDVFACLYHDAALPNSRSYEGATRLIDLTCDLDSIFAAFTKGTRYEINRASQRDGIQAEVPKPPLGLQLGEFMDYYDHFASSKGVAPIQRDQFRALADAGKLTVSVARNSTGSILAAHAYLVASSRARLTHSASFFRTEADPAVRAQVGRANRFLHWSDLKAFRARGVSYYDFGGWYEGSRNSALLNINAFKKEFAGQVVKEWNSFQRGSLVGSVYLTFRDLMVRTRR